MHRILAVLREQRFVSRSPIDLRYFLGPAVRDLTEKNVSGAGGMQSLTTVVREMSQGRGFDLPATAGPLLAIGRGIGVCSFMTLIEDASAAGVPSTVVLSARTDDRVIGRSDCAELGAEALDRRLAARFADRAPGLVVVCGSHRLTALAMTLARRWRVPLQVSVEAHMACGAGVVNARVAARAGAAPWPAAGEERVVDRDLSIAADTGGHLHVCHLSTAGSVELIRQAKRSGVRVTCEVTPHHLVLDDEAALRAGGALKVNPPLRAAADVLALRAALADGTIDVVATDHAPHPQATKTRGWADSAFGLTGLETALSVVAMVLRAPDTGRVDWARLTEVLSVVPARIGGIAPRAGRPVRVGEPADLCVVETGVPRPIRVDRHRNRSRNNPFGGWTVRERVVRTLVGGRVAH
ncbi:dihydroorotase [Micromonospora haikouensis]|uniref:Dihydroorotase n=1 Tax=Micromonospora haikouensis TaxID=686309 RepID=A0A1C4WC37_9ACTN|nr:amidohydrolase family protein [Micromonospora haikouensis]SCE93734.1 dihydroorotase [Micromonospora haikouensis]